MDFATLKNVINANGGEENVIAFHYDVGSGKMFNVDECHLDQMYHSQSKTLGFIEKTIDGYPYYCYRPVEDIQGIVMATDGYGIDEYDRYNIR